jgi:RHS repeat-associated protein
VTWTGDNLAASITRDGSNWSSFVYGPDRQRWQQVNASTGNGQATIHYVGSLYEREDRGIGAYHRFHVYAGGQAVAVQTWVSGSVSTRYLHRDHQGSVVAMTSSGGALYERSAYDAWGKRRDASTGASLNALSWLANPAPVAALGYRRGYTGHEHLDQLGLIHMNGRVYDPEVARFLSADPFVQFPGSTQGYNRYAYVNNSPLSSTDPSGYFVQFILAAKMMAAGGAIAASGTLMMAHGIHAAVQGFQQGGLGGMLHNVSLGGLSATFSFGIGDMFLAAKGTYNFLMKSLLHGVTQGAMSRAGGGRFGDGFLGGIAGSITEGINLPTGPVGVIIAATLGGAVSKIGGGKFANGALSAAFVRAFNHDGDHDTSNSNQLPRFKRGQIVITNGEARAVLQYFFPGLDAPRVLTPQDRAFAQALFALAVDRTAAMGWLNRVFDLGGSPVPVQSAGSLAMRIASAAGKEAFRHADNSELTEARVYKAVRNQVARTFRSEYEQRLFYGTYSAVEID